MKIIHLLLITNLSLLLLTLTGCSHTKPYYRSELLETDKIVIQDTTLIERFILIGDAGETLEDDPVLASLFQWCSKDAAITHVLFLGDNICIIH